MPAKPAASAIGVAAPGRHQVDDGGGQSGQPHGARWRSVSPCSAHSAAIAVASAGARHRQRCGARACAPACHPAARQSRRRPVRWRPRCRSASRSAPARAAARAARRTGRGRPRRRGCQLMQRGGCPSSHRPAVPRPRAPSGCRRWCRRSAWWTPARSRSRPWRPGAWRDAACSGAGRRSAGS